jgi:hypothetical protein
MTGAGETLFAIIAWVVLGLALLAVLYGLSTFFGRERKRPQLPDYGAHGDWPAIPRVDPFHAQFNSGGAQHHHDA